MKDLMFIILALFTFFCANAQDEGMNICRAKYEEEGVAESFVAGKNWFPYPAYGDREGWDALFGDYKDEIMRKGEEKLDFEWKTIPATAYLAFERTGDRQEMEHLQFENKDALLSLIFAELAEGKGRFIDQIANGVWLSSQQFSWVWSAHQVRQKTKRALPDGRDHLIDLGSGNYAAIMAIAYHFFHDEFDKLDPSISFFAKNAVREHILDPYLDEGKYGENSWLGLDKERSLNNWTPWCNSNAVLCFLLMEEDQDRLDECINMSISSVDNFLNYIQKDGACEEGTMYWGHSAVKLYEYLQILYDASDGKFSLFDNERLRRYGEFISRAYIGDEYVVNYADGSARIQVPKELVWYYGHAFGSKEMTDMTLYRSADPAAGVFVHPDLITVDTYTVNRNDIYHAMQSLRFNPLLKAQVDSLNLLVKSSSFEEVLASLREEVPATTWYEETENGFFRNSSNWFLGVKGGYNAESHNHNDVGSCVLFIRNIPVLIDVGVETYTRQTFASAERYKIWTMQSDWHNLPMINGVPQREGRQYRSKNVVVSTGRGRFSLDLADAYPEEAGCLKWERSYSFALSGTPSLKINDSFSLSERSGADVEHFIVKGEVILPGEEYGGNTLKDGELLILCDGGPVVRMEFPKALAASVDVKVTDDRKLLRAWGTTIRRINLTSSESATLRGSYEIRFTELK